MTSVPRPGATPLAPRRSGRLRAVIFDMDGVLVSSNRLHWKAYARTFETQGREFPWSEYQEVAIGASREDVITRVLGELAPGKLERLMALKEDYVRELIDTGGIEPVPGAREFVREVERRGLGTAVATSSRAPLLFLRAAGFEGVFRTVIDRSQVVRSKPHPDCYLAAAEALGLPPSSCLVLEDSPAGIDAATAAGMTVLALSTTVAPAELRRARAVFSGFAEIRLDEWL